MVLYTNCEYGVGEEVLALVGYWEEDEKKVEEKQDNKEGIHGIGEVFCFHGIHGK